jgi:hypothetical protein
VQDVALEAINGIAAREFGDAIHVRDSLWPEIRERVDAWWATYQSKGEASVLSEGVRAKTRDSAEQARRLAARYPEHALDPIREAASGSPEHEAADLVAALAVVATPSVQVFLRECVAADRPLCVRMAAAEALHAQGADDGVHVLLRRAEHRRRPLREEDPAELLRSIPLPALGTHAGDPGAASMHTGRPLSGRWERPWLRPVQVGRGA